MHQRYIDIHTHILPGADDGSKAYEDSVKMLQDAYAAGTGTVILTPHYKQKYSCGSAEDIRTRFVVFRDFVAEKVPIALFLGTEAMYEVDLPKKLINGEVLTMADSVYVLTEFLPHVNYEYLCNGVFKMMQCGYTPILAHIERYACLTKERVLELTDMGAKLQINARSVLGRSGFKAKRFCSGILKLGSVDFIASDAHDFQIRNAQLCQCAKYVGEHFGKEYANSVMVNNAKKILNLNL